MIASSFSRLSLRPARAWPAILATCTLLACQVGFAEQRLDLEGTAIFGNKESPNILYVVPWRKSSQIGPMQPPALGSLDELMAPIDRDVFRRQVDLHQTFGEKP